MIIHHCVFEETVDKLKQTVKGQFVHGGGHFGTIF